MKSNGVGAGSRFPAEEHSLCVDTALIKAAGLAGVVAIWVILPRLRCPVIGGCTMTVFARLKRGAGVRGKPCLPGSACEARRAEGAGTSKTCGAS